MPETKEKAKANVYEKIANIQQSIHTVIKGGFNDFHKYKFARERDVVAEIKPMLGREGLCITHTLVEDVEVPHGKTQKGDEKYLTKLTILFRITNVKDKDDFVECRAIGYGQDGEDKGAPKAYTMALKYFLSKTFLVETGDDVENDKNKKGAAATEDKFEKAMRMVKESRNIEGLFEYTENLASAKSSFTVAQKNQLKKAVEVRIAEIEKNEK